MTLRHKWLPWLLALPVAGCGRFPQSTFDPAGPVARREAELFNLTAIIVALIGLIVTVLLIYIVLRFKDTGDGARAPQIRGNRRLQVLWTLIPVAFVLYKAVPTVVDAFYLATPPPAAMRINVIGHQWWWEFQYPDLGITTANELHLPTGQAADLTVTSADVIHGFWVPRLAGKVDAIPNRLNKLWLQADEAGTFSGQCTELCGTSHANMHFNVVGQSPADFDAWVARMQTLAKNPVQPGDALAKQGQDLFMGARPCYTCHAIDGTKASGKVGPNLTGFGLRTTVGAGLLPSTADGLTRWLHDPQAVKPGTIMPNLQLSETELQRLVAYLQAQK